MTGALCSSSQQLWAFHHFNPPCLPWPPNEGCCPGQPQSAPRARRKPGRIAPRQLQFSPPKCFISPFLQHLGAVIHPGPQLQGQTRRDKARAARSPGATTSTAGVLGQGKGEHPSLLFSHTRTWQVFDTWACKAAKAASPRPDLCTLPPAHRVVGRAQSPQHKDRAPRHSSPRHTATPYPKAQPQSHPCPVGSRRVDHRRRGACNAWGLQSKTTSLEQGWADRTQAQEEHTPAARLNIFCPRCPSSMSFAPEEDEAST